MPMKPIAAPAALRPTMSTANNPPSTASKPLSVKPKRMNAADSTTGWPGGV